MPDRQQSHDPEELVEDLALSEAESEQVKGGGNRLDLAGGNLQDMEAQISNLMKNKNQAGQAIIGNIK